MSTINDKATVSLFVNGEQAEAAMERLRKSASDLDKQLQAALAAGNKKEASSLQRQLDKVNKELNRTESAAKGTGIVLNNLSNSSIGGLRNALKYLEKELRNTKPDTEQWHRYANSIKEVKGRIAELTDGLKEQRSIWAKFKDWSQSAWPAIDLLQQWGGNFVDVARGAVDAYASMDQEMANVRKFTGMTEEQVAALNEEFKKMDTRTSREELNKLAQEAGRLGKTSQEDVIGFVRAADQINVALDDLGEGATLTLSKLTGVFGDEARYGTEQSLLKVGSVINELSQNCSASAPYLADFAARMGGVGAQANMTIPQIMAFGSVLDANGLAVEASATALSQIIVRMMQEPAKYAQVAGLDIKQFSDMLKTDVNGALILFLETLGQAGGMDRLSPMFKDMGENGARAIASLTTLANHIDMVKQQQEAANTAFEEGTSVTNEFNVQNNTVQAGLDKCKKAVNDLRVELGERLAPVMGHMLSSSSAILRALLSTIQFIANHKAAIAALAAATVAYIAVINHELIVKKLRNAIDTIHYGYLVLESKATAALSVVTEGLRLVYFRLTGETTKAMVAQKAFTAAMAVTPWGAILTAVSAALVAFNMFDSEVESTTEKLEILENGTKDANARLAEETAVLQQNIQTLKTFNGTKEAEQRLVSSLNKKYGDFFGTCKTAKEWYETLTKSGNDYCNTIYRQILLEAKRQQALDLAKKAAEARENADYSRNADGSAISNGQVLEEFVTNLKYILSGDQLSWEGSLVSLQIKNGNYWIEQADALEARAKQMMEDYAKEVASMTPFSQASDSGSGTPTPEPKITPTAPSTGKDRFATEKAARERAEAVARISYAKGESDYETYTSRMNEIAKNYFSMLLERTDLSKDERLKTLADYWEAVNKDTKHQTSLLLQDENAFYEKDRRDLEEAYLRKREMGGMSAKEREDAEKAHAEALELLELEHYRNLVTMTEAGTPERLKAEKDYYDARIKAQQRHIQEYEKAQADAEKQRAAIKDEFFGMNQTEKDKEFGKQFAALKEVYDQELKAVGDNEAEKLRIKEAFMAAELALRKKYNQEGAQDSKSAYQSAIDGSVEWLNGDGGKALTGTLSTLTSGMSSIFSGLSTMIQAELEMQTANIEKRYKREIELAQGNSYKVAKLEKKKEADIAKAKNEANRKMFAMQVIQAVAQTATNALNAYGSAAAIPVVGYILAPIAAAMAVAAGVIQVAAIKKQQQASEAQGYSQGGFTKPGGVNEPAGVVHAGEWVASQKLLANPVARPMIEALDYAQRTNTIGSLRPEDVSRSIRANDSLVRMAETDGSGALVAAAVAQSAQAVSSLTQRLNEPFVTVNTVTGDHGIKQAQDEYSRLMDNVTPKYKRKK